MSEATPKGLWPAVTDIERLGGHRLRLYRMYDRDRALSNAITRLFSEWWVKFGPAFRRLDDCLPDLNEAMSTLENRVGVDNGRAYLHALHALGQEVGFDRIPMVGTPPVVVAGYLPSGMAQLHRYLWHLDKALLFEAAPADFKEPSLAVHRPRFVGLASFATPVPAVDGTIAGTQARWDPRAELLADARRRLPQVTGLPQTVVDRELRRIAAVGGYQFPDTSTKRSGVFRMDRDTLWAFWRIRHRWTYEGIAREWDRRHPGDIRLQVRQDDAVSPEEASEPWLMTAPEAAVGLIRKAVTTFASRARIDVRTGPGPRGEAR